MSVPTPLDRLLARAAGRVVRLTPEQAWAELGAGSRLIDLRALEARARRGVVPGSLHVPLSVLQWRLDPGGTWRTPHVEASERVVLLCDDGCSSLLAAESLLEMGLDASDVVGGLAAWAEAGLPLIAADDAPLAAGELPGMRPPA